jgi:hypothetical protein
MIHRELCDPLKTKEYTPLRMQFHFLLSRHVCIDGYVPLTRNQIATRLSCTLQTVDKFLKDGVEEGIVQLDGDRLYFLKRVNHEEGYVKHFPFLESKEFMGLHLHAQRFILYMLWIGVYSGRTFVMELSSLYHSTPERQGKLNIYDRATLYLVLEQVKSFLHLEILQHEKKGDYVRVTGLKAPYNQQAVLENMGEQLWLDDVLFDEGIDTLPSEIRIEILKQKKSYYSSYQHLGLELFQHGLKKLLSSFFKLADLIRQGIQSFGAYFKSILKNEEESILPQLKARAQYLGHSVRVSRYLLNHDDLVHYFASRRKSLDAIITKILKTADKVDGVKERSREPAFVPYNWLEN